MENSGISWTHNTQNFWVGCDKIAPGCGHCYIYREIRKQTDWHAPDVNGYDEKGRYFKHLPKPMRQPWAEVYLTKICGSIRECRAMIAPTFRSRFGQPSMHRTPAQRARESGLWPEQEVEIASREHIPFVGRNREQRRLGRRDQSRQKRWQSDYRCEPLDDDTRSEGQNLGWA